MGLVQFGGVFSYPSRRACVGVLSKYGNRGCARYPILWGFPDRGKLPILIQLTLRIATQSRSSAEAVIDVGFEAGSG